MSPTVPPISQTTKSSSARSAWDELLDRVGDVGDDLHRGAQVVAAPLLGDHVASRSGPVVTLSDWRAATPVKRS